MPIGNGDIGLNTWVEKSGDLVFTIGKTDAWEENARLAKVGRIRMKLEPLVRMYAGPVCDVSLRRAERHFGF